MTKLKKRVYVTEETWEMLEYLKTKLVNNMVLGKGQCVDYLVLQACQGSLHWRKMQSLDQHTKEMDESLFLRNFQQ